MEVVSIQRNAMQKRVCFVLCTACFHTANVCGIPLRMISDHTLDAYTVAYALLLASQATIGSVTSAALQSNFP